jgi:hypothetical protein
LTYSIAAMIQAADIAFRRASTILASNDRLNRLELT